VEQKNLNYKVTDSLVSEGRELTITYEISQSRNPKHIQNILTYVASSSCTCNLCDFAHNLSKTHIHHSYMSFFLDTQETSQRFGNHISEFRSLLDTHQIPHGSPENLFEFKKILESNHQFRLDLLATVKSVVREEGDELLLTDMVSIVAASVAGPSFADTHIDISKPTNALMEFLLGTGCWRQFGSPSSAGNQHANPPSGPPIRIEQPRATPRFPSSDNPIANKSPHDRNDLSELRQMLMRLEADSQKVKLQLDSIEQRISKIAPLSEISLERAPSSPEPILHPNSVDDPDIAPREVAQIFTEDLSKEDNPVFEQKSPTVDRAVFSHPLDQSDEDDFPSPTFSYATEKGRSLVPVRVFLALLAVIAFSLLFAYSESGRSLLAAGISRLKAVRAHFSSASVTAPQPSTETPRPPASLQPPAIAAPAPPSPTPPSTTANNIVETPPSPAMASNEASSGDTSSTNPDLDTPSIKYVPANVMEAHLLSAPRPQYPHHARAGRTEGSVALQTTISKTGSIESLHVIKGPQALRGAAIDAVRRWRYRPYAVDGRPTKVVTTVYVHFTLKPPSPIAH
jgi:TonB family protein